MKIKFRVLSVALFAALSLSNCPNSVLAIDSKFPKEYLAPKHVAYENMSYSFEFDIDVNFSGDGKATPFIKNLKKRNPDAWGSLGINPRVKDIRKGSDRVTVEVEVEAVGHAKPFSQAYGQPLQWGEASKDETRIKFDELVIFPFEMYPDLARIESFEPGGTAQLSAQEEETAPKPEGQEATSTSYVNFVEGKVEVKRADGMWRVAEQGMELEAGDIIRTSEDGYVTLVNLDYSIVRLKPITEIVITKMSPRRKVTFIEIIRGVLWARAKKDDESLKVATPNAVCGVRGTEFEVSYKDNISCVEVFEGTVWLSSSEGDPAIVISAGNKSCIPAGS